MVGVAAATSGSRETLSLPTAKTPTATVGLDGVRRELTPPVPVDKNLYALSAREARRIRQLPRSLDESLDALERGHDFWLTGGVFNTALLESHLELEREESDAARLRPSPTEYTVY